MLRTIYLTDQFPKEIISNPKSSLRDFWWRPFHLDNVPENVSHKFLGQYFAPRALHSSCLSVINLSSLPATYNCFKNVTPSSGLGRKIKFDKLCSDLIKFRTTHSQTLVFKKINSRFSRSWQLGGLVPTGLVTVGPTKVWGW